MAGRAETDPRPTPPGRLRRAPHLSVIHGRASHRDRPARAAAASCQCLHRRGRCRLNRPYPDVPRSPAARAQRQRGRMPHRQPERKTDQQRRDVPGRTAPPTLVAGRPPTRRHSRASFRQRPRSFRTSRVHPLGKHAFRRRDRALCASPAPRDRAIARTRTRPRRAGPPCGTLIASHRGPGAALRRLRPFGDPIRRPNLPSGPDDGRCTIHTGGGQIGSDGGKRCGGRQRKMPIIGTRAREVDGIGGLRSDRDADTPGQSTRGRRAGAAPDAR
jgi:hypothetical protein